MKPPVIRTVVIRARDLPDLKQKALVKSIYGTKKLYDTLDFRLLTEQDFLIHLLKNPRNDKATIRFQLKQWIGKHYLYDRTYLNWELDLRDKGFWIKPIKGKREWDQLGIATLTKTFS
jgi:hypothetical protein